MDLQKVMSLQKKFGDPNSKPQVILNDYSTLYKEPIQVSATY